MNNIITPEFRVSYAHFIKPHAITEGDEKKYSCKVVLERSNDDHVAFVKKLKTVAVTIAKERWGKVPAKLALPFTNGDNTDNPEFEGCILFNATRKEDFGKPDIVDADRQDIIDPQEIYSGMFCRVSLSPYAWTYGKKQGVSFGLVNVQKTRDGDPLGGGGVKASDEFDAFAAEGGFDSEPSDDDNFDDDGIF